MKFINSLLISLNFIFSLSVFSQIKPELSNLFRSPVDIPIYLSGNFGELRGNHFHSGLDIKTNQVEGLHIYAVADGFVSRIKIGLYGYGKALYVTHPNGYTTVYAHLQKFSPEIETYTKKAQYNSKAYIVELFPNSDVIPVKKGDVIAVSGNTGGSGGPHLHFEIRDTKTESPLNPLHFGFDIKDNIKPTLKTLSIYPLNDTSIVNGKNEPLHLSLREQNGIYNVPGPLDITARGVIGFGIEAQDFANGSHNRIGVYSIEFFVDGEKHYSHFLDKVPFHLTRYINSHIDYEETTKNKRRIQKSFLDPGNHLNIYRDVKFNGKVFFSNFGHELNYVVKDAYGNESTLKFKVDFDSISPSSSKIEDGLYFAYQKENLYTDENIRIHFPAKTLYRDLYFTHKSMPSGSKFISEIHHIGKSTTPLHDYIFVEIKCELPNNTNHQKLTAVSLNSSNGIITAEGGEWNNGWIKFKTRSLGPYSVMLDTVPPTIKPKYKLNADGSLKTLNNRVSFKVTDNLSDINSFNAYINEQWVLMEYDKKTNEMWIDKDIERFGKEQLNLRIVVNDNVGNTAYYTNVFQW